jgi:hypothetical protein
VCIAPSLSSLAVRRFLLLVLAETTRFHCIGGLKILRVFGKTLESGDVGIATGTGSGASKVTSSTSGKRPLNPGSGSSSRGRDRDTETEKGNEVSIADSYAAAVTARLRDLRYRPLLSPLTSSLSSSS